MRLWNPNTGQPIGHALTGHTQSVRGVAFSPDDQRTASGSLDRTVRVWPIITSLQLLCDKLTANMTHKQWRDWVSPNVGYRIVCQGLPVPPE